LDEQFGKFVEVIQKLYVNIPLLDAIQVPTYAKYIRDILNKKRPLLTTEVMKLTEECSAAILNKEEGSRMPHQLIARSKTNTSTLHFVILEQVLV